MSDEVQAAQPAKQMPKWLECWRSQEEIDNPMKRQRWLGRFTFILAAIGSAIGLGNFWRFPYLTYKHGGAIFFFPWATCLVVMGIPYMIMELALGQKFQRGDIAVFRGINKNLAGIGVISVYSSYIFSFYYNVVVAWAAVYVVVAFYSPLPWSRDIKGKTWTCPEDEVSRAEQFFKVNVIRLVDENCKEFADGDPTTFSWTAFGSTLAVWFIIFLCVFKGVSSSSYIVWATVPIPVLFVIIMIINGNVQDGASDGIKKYFSGKEGAEATSAASQWSDAAGQIFLGLSVCLGIMTSYGSYNEVKKPIILDSFIISVSNCGFSFIAGFAVWAIVGYLEKQGTLKETKTSSVGLAFITYPTAIDLMPGSNIWAFLLGATLFLLGIDSSFSAIEATSTVICDTAWGGVVPRSFVAFVLCVFGFMGSVPFCTNWGFTLFDVVDHYLCAYLLLMIGILQAFGCGWFFDAAPNMAKSEGHRKSIQWLTITYWVLLLIVGFVATITDVVAAGFIGFSCVYLFICIPVSYKLSNLTPSEWYNDCIVTGVKRIAYACSQMGREDPKVVQWWEPIFCVYWSFLIKYINPAALYFMFVGILLDDIKKPYEGYSTGWQAIGWTIPILGFVLFLGSFCVCVSTEVLDYEAFELDEFKTDEQLKKVSPDGEGKAEAIAEIELEAQPDQAAQQ